MSPKYEFEHRNVHMSGVSIISWAWSGKYVETPRLSAITNFSINV